VLLEREVVLPLAAEAELNNVLRYEMNQLTPFTAEQVYWSATTQRRDAGRGKLTLRLSMIPKLPFAPLLGALRDAGLPATDIEVAEPGPGGRMRVIGLRERPPERGWRSRTPELLGVICACLAVAAIALPFALQFRRAATLDQEIARLAPRVRQTETLRQQLSSAARTGSVIAAARAEMSDPLAVLAAVTQALPNDSSLNQLTLNHLQLNIAGQSAAAAALLAALSAYPIMTNVAFSAPVTRDTTSQKDLFSIQSTIAPATAAPQ
jgi:general secretion pathway protein L